MSYYLLCCSNVSLLGSNTNATSQYASVVFAENECGCWVQRIFETGNAATKSKGDKIVIGDQLASINGRSVVGNTVGDVCRVLANVPDKNAIALGFVRYIGPLHPASNEQQG